MLLSSGNLTRWLQLLGLSLAIAFCCALTSAVLAVPEYPDLVPIADEEENYMYGGEFDLLSEPGRVLYRFDAALANLGDGVFEIRYESDEPNGTQDVYQRLYDANDELFEETLMGTFVYEDPPFGELSLTALAQYDLREVLPDQGVGDAVASKAKTSHAVVDSVAIDLSLPGAPSSGVYRNVNQNPLGISIGYADLYGRNIPQQRIDVTGLPSGQYWLEVTVDPWGYVQESDESNNTTRILVDLTIPTTGDNDQDGDVDGRDFLMWQAGESPNGTSAEDLADWETYYGATYPSPLSANAAVPETVSTTLVIISAMLASVWRDSRCR